MPNAVLEALRAQRAEQLSTMDSILSAVEGRDLSTAETSLLEAARGRIQAIDAQIEPLEGYEALRGAHSEALDRLAPNRPALPAEPRRADGGDRAVTYRTAGEFIVDLLRARGMGDRGATPDPAAVQRIAQSRALVDQTTGDTPGILPTPIVGSVVNLIDSNRPLISSLGGALPLGNIKGTTFTRPKITTHTLVGKQTAEKTVLASQAMKIDPVPFAKETYGGTVDISRQDIDWTDPSAWDILVKDLADVYAIQTETVIAAAFKTAGIGTPVVVAGDTLQEWADALYAAAAASYGASKRMPDRIWCSLDVWAALGSMVDVARLVLPPTAGDESAGSSTLASFRGDVIGLPRIVVPTFPSGTCIIGPSSLYEVYEEVIGLLSVIEPSILGVTVAYGGYVAYGTLAAAGFVPLTPPAGMRTFDVNSFDAPTGDDDEADEPAKPAAKASK
jgi:HK97 family phage major capsid protein